MRWDRLFADLEGQAVDLELEERDALVEELHDGEWAETSWRDLLGGHVVLVVIGLGRVEGDVRLVNEHVVHLATDRAESVLSTAAVLEVISSERRGVPPTVVTSRLGWGHVLRSVRDAGERVRLIRTDGIDLHGTVDVVGRDFVRLSEPAHTVPFTAIAAVTLSAT